MKAGKQIWLCIGAALLTHGLAFAQPKVDVRDYRELDDKQLGHLRFIANVADQKFNDWSKMDSSEAGQGGFDAYRYQLAMMSYATNLANYHYTPAYRELHQRTTDRLIAKMLRFDVWSFWEQVSQGAKMFDPDLVKLSEGWRDPVIKQNIMYSGHLMQMVATYAMLYDSDKYERPGAITFVHDPVGRGLGKEEFVYDAGKLAAVLRDQFEAGGYAGIECEPNAIFAECNQHPILGFKLHDRRNGTRYFDEVSASYKKTFDEQKFIDRANGSFMRFKLVRQNKVLAAEMPWNDGWAGIFMHAWSRQDVEDIYPLLRKKYVVRQADGTAVIPFKKPSVLFSWDNGFFAALAAEVGDKETVQAMLAYADKQWSPTWIDGGLHYPRNDEFSSGVAVAETLPADRFVSPRVNTLTGNALLALARINVKDGLYEMFAKPWSAHHFKQPFLADVPYPQAHVSRAVYDERTKALVATIKPASGAAERTTFSVGNLPANGSFNVWINNGMVGKVVAGAATSASTTTELSMSNGRLRVATAFDRPIDVVIQRLP
jgi:Linalool dehydratase/isomerase